MSMNLVGDPFKVFPAWSRSASLCEPCLERFQSWHFQPYDHEGIKRGSEPPTFSYSVSREGLASSVTFGCPLCKMFMETMSLKPEARSLGIKYQMLNTNPQKDPSNIDLFRVEESWLGAAGEKHRTAYDFWMHAALDNPASKYFRTRDVNPYIGSPSAYKQAHRWIKECCESHIDCPKRAVGPLPTRVIDVQSLSASGDPRLFITEHLEAEYATLSYCWGSEQPESLTKERLPRYLEGIPISSMPQTIQDAITVTGELGLRYLWIDSLCIIQNSKEDKRAEISKMRQIFKHSLVTISAASARSVSQGFLAPRPQPIPSIRIPLRCPDGSGGVVLLYLDGEEPHLLYEESGHPIESRAWTLEEKILSPRVLIYSSTHLRWLCDSSQYSDGGAQENFMDYEPAKYRLPVKERKRPYHPSDNNVSSLSLYDSWHTLVGEYTRRCLTAPEDKLRAIGGLAEEYHLLMNDTYLAGLWKSKLGIELIWRRNSYSDAGKLSPRPIKYRAPSWSWASVDGEVAIKWKPIELVKFDIDGCEITPLSTFAPFGEVAKGILKVRARLKDAWFDPIEEGLFDKKDGNKLADVVPDALEKATLMPGTVKSLAISANHGLVLVPTESDENVYRRVGWQYFSNDDFFDGREQRIVTVV